MAIYGGDIETNAKSWLKAQRDPRISQGAISFTTRNTITWPTEQGNEDSIYADGQSFQGPANDQRLAIKELLCFSVFLYEDQGGDQEHVGQNKEASAALCIHLCVNVDRYECRRYQ